ncbi:MAG: thioredoxin family protein [Flavobacterium sp.]
MVDNKKTTIVFGILLLIMTNTVFAQKKSNAKNDGSGQEILFQGKSWRETLAQAKITDKYIFVDAYTTWCGPCRLLKSTTFRDKSTVVFFNENFINYAVDMEKGEGVVLAEKWNVTAYPSLLFFSPDGKMVLKQIGYLDGKKLIEFGKQALEKK